jgi:molybdopterin-binding protein
MVEIAVTVLNPVTGKVDFEVIEIPEGTVLTSITLNEDHSAVEGFEYEEEGE